MTENSIGARLAALFTLVCCILMFSAPARAVEFRRNMRLKLVETKTGLVPELCWDDPREWVILPGAKIKAGSFTYLYDFFSTKRNREEEEETCKAGLLFDDALYYVESSDVGGDTNFGVYKDYFLMDSWAYGSVSGHNRTMFLFRYDKKSARLLDAIGEASVAHDLLDFMSDYALSHKPGYDREANKSPVWMDIADIDLDGRPELAIKIVRGPYWTYYDRKFSLFIEIRDDRLRLDLNQALYRPLFEKEREKAKGKGFKPDAYYIYGFLAKEFTLDKVKAMLKDELYVAEAKRHFKKHDAEYYDQYESVVPLLESRDKWDYKFHRDKEYLIKYEIKRR
ncbi:MAG: hypothetical protein HZB21_02335 [Deltaproteobacteria bacterium]|nr:hypothetical protein [Deltaproteobacteria bacterium]